MLYVMETAGVQVFITTGINTWTHPFPRMLNNPYKSTSNIEQEHVSHRQRDTYRYHEPSVTRLKFVIIAADVAAVNGDSTVDIRRLTNTTS